MTAALPDRSVAILLVAVSILATFAVLGVFYLIVGPPRPPLRDRLRRRP